MRSRVACAAKKKPQTCGGRKAAFGRAAYCTPVRNGCKVFLFVIFYFIFLIGLWRQQNGLSGAVSPLSSGAVRGFCGAGGCDQNAAQPDHERTHRACVSVLRHARNGQNLDGEGVRARGQLRTPGERRSLRHVRHLPGAGGGKQPRYSGNRRGQQQRRGRDPRFARKGEIPAADGALSRVYHRRGAHALAGRVQRAAQDAGRAARLRRVHFGDDGAAEAPGDDPFPLPAVRFRADSRAPDHRAAARRAGGRPYSGRGRGAFPHRPRGGGRHARRMVDHGHVPFLRAGGGRRADGGARASGARRGG